MPTVSECRKTRSKSSENGMFAGPLTRCGWRYCSYELSGFIGKGRSFVNAPLLEWKEGERNGVFRLWQNGFRSHAHRLTYEALIETPRRSVEPGKGAISNP